jgi:hypothetical protein
VNNLYHEINISEIEVSTAVNTKSTEFVGMTPWSRVDNYLGFSKWEMGCILEMKVIGPFQKSLYVYEVTEVHIPGGGVHYPLEET